MNLNISSKVRTIVTDDASNMRKAMSVLLSSSDGNSDDEVDDPSL